MKKTIVDSIELVEAPKKREEPVVTMKDTRNYVDNVKLLEDFKVYRSEYLKFRDGERDTMPRMSEYMGLCIMKIANGYSNHHRFRGYTNAWKDEMIGSAIEACVKYLKSFDPEKSDNPFSYITYAVHTAFINRIKVEKTAQYVRYKMFDACGGFNAVNDVGETDNPEMTEFTSQYSDALEFINHFETSLAYAGKKPKVEAEAVPKPLKGLDAIMIDED
jgi:hypothetical protein